jgi:hypothetical protein
MTRFDVFRIEVLKGASRIPDGWPVRTHELANRYGIEERFVREILVKLHQQEFIELCAWDGSSHRLLDAWPSVDYFFDFAFDGHYKKVRLLAPGAEFLESLKKPEAPPAPKSAIGFTANL